MKKSTIALTVALSLLGTFLASAQSSDETIITPSEFETLTTGKTLYFSRNGRFFGAEQFYTRQRTLWQIETGECSDGEWYAKGDLICFVYDTNPDPQCWHFINKPSGYVARAEGATSEFDLMMHKLDNKPLDCKGPSVGA